MSECAFTLMRAGVRTAPAVRARTECSHMNKEGVFTLPRADVRAACGEKPTECHAVISVTRKFLRLVHDILGVRNLSFQ